MTIGKKINDFSTAGNKINDQWEKNTCQAVKKSMASRNKVNDFLTVSK